MGGTDPVDIDRQGPAVRRRLGIGGLKRRREFVQLGERLESVQAVGRVGVVEDLLDLLDPRAVVLRAIRGSSQNTPTVDARLRLVLRYARNGVADALRVVERQQEMRCLDARGSIFEPLAKHSHRALSQLGRDGGDLRRIDGCTYWSRSGQQGDDHKARTQVREGHAGERTREAPSATLNDTATTDSAAAAYTFH